MTFAKAGSLLEALNVKSQIYVGTEDRKSIVKQLKEVGSASSYDGRQDNDGIDIRNYLFAGLFHSEEGLKCANTKTSISL
jgi:hypothetical protein